MKRKFLLVLILMLAASFAVADESSSLAWYVGKANEFDIDNYIQQSRSILIEEAQKEGYLGKGTKNGFTTYGHAQDVKELTVKEQQLLKSALSRSRFNVEKDDVYRIQIVSTHDAGYELTAQASHILVRITKVKGNGTFDYKWVSIIQIVYEVL